MREFLRRFTVVSCLALAATVAPAQAKPAFEVASIRPAAPLDMTKLAAAVQAGQTPRLGPRVAGTRAEYIYMALRDLIVLAYNVKPHQITGPDWIANQRFDIVAKFPDGASKDDVPKMLQALLEERFKLALHRESKEHPVLALVVGKGGPKMKESVEAPKPIDPDAPLAPGERAMDGPDGPIRMKTNGTGGFVMNMGDKGTISSSLDPATRSMKLEASRVNMDGFADMLTSFSQIGGGGLQVRDMTGLKGYYQIEITFSLKDLMTMAQNMARTSGIALPAGAAAPAMPAGEASDPGGSSSLFQAVQSMGLKLEQRKAMVEQLVIDHIERTPTEN
jgi:uncharacterized protein (TIGR03435 family)